MDNQEKLKLLKFLAPQQSLPMLRELGGFNALMALL